MEEKNELKEKVVAINRVAKVVKGGRTFRFSAVVVVGDENGHVGVGNGKASEVPDAIKKAIGEAKKNLVEVPVVETTVPHEFVGTFGSAKVMLKPAAIGTGVIAGGSVRPVLELAGYKNIRTKVIGTNNPRNVVYATIEGLKSMQTVESVAKKRGKKVVAINRVAKVVKGGRTFRFSAVVVVGDENGHVGVGNGKASEVPDAIKKAIGEAKKNLVEVPVVETTVPHEFVGTFGSAKVMLKPAAIGTGVIAGGSVRPVLELAGYKNIRTKVIGTNNPRNVVYATIEGLKSMQTVESVAKKRGKKVEEIL